ncbi:HAD family hydrolase [Marinomonas posidonica]|uniref:Haloacid dehalogenase domain protein hydrolase n=1 Tax=Marinomonas posidonica (strain CECT 7376 / NCIMB 14433 / IVIA-Po-181) TaxID=491952 RepID=F6D0H9_MARPP|nr:HAD family hydrolase [Marinomonas posidonica]AEF54777.1 Haloacid dehalogenase domain protein hydrolase [Marinomonas posidonica IVIA-Po-181]
MKETRQAFKTIAFDADDTLWRNEEIFMNAQDEFIRLLSPYHSETYIRDHLGEVQIRNLEHFGYGIKGFTLSMIETAIELTEGRILGSEVHQIIDLAKCMVAMPVEILPNIEVVLKTLQSECQLMVITKGDLLDQESKFARSGIVDYFDVIEVVSEKTPATYEQILNKHHIRTEDFLMIGNSLKSDILPVLDLGAKAIHIPYHSTWAHELVDDTVLAEYDDLVQLSDVMQVLEYLHCKKAQEVVV